MQIMCQQSLNNIALLLNVFSVYFKYLCKSKISKLKIHNHWIHMALKQKQVRRKKISFGIHHQLWKLYSWAIFPLVRSLVEENNHMFIHFLLNIYVSQISTITEFIWFCLLNIYIFFPGYIISKNMYIS